jgi:hypothetical protein
MNHISYVRGNLIHISHRSNQIWEGMSSSLESNTRWDEFISNIRNDLISSLIDVQLNAPQEEQIVHNKQKRGEYRKKKKHST